jgi:hypothetical protein
MASRGFEVLPSYTYPETIRLRENVSLPAVREGPAAGECEPQGRHCGGPHCPQKGTAVVLQHMTILSEQIICLKDSINRVCTTNEYTLTARRKVQQLHFSHSKSMLE